MQLEILSPGKPLFKGEADNIILPAEEGELGILEGHAPFLSRLKKGTIRITAGREEKAFAIETGFVEVNEGGVTILVKE